MSVNTYFCFCCLSTQDLLQLRDENPESKYASILKELFSITLAQDMDDDSYVCRECSCKLESADQFKRQVLHSLRTLRFIGLINILKVNEELLVKKVSSPDIKLEVDEEPVINVKTQDENVNTAGHDVEPPHSKVEQPSEDTHPALPLNSVKPKEGDRDVASYEVTKDLVCELCHWPAPNLYSYHGHMNNHFPNHTCEVCGKAFTTEKRLKRHKYCHKTDSFVCQVCGKQFNNYSTFYAHKKRHTSIPAYKCPLCPRRFKSLSSRARHAAETHHKNTTYRCKECPKEFLTAGLLSSHVQYKHVVLKRHSCADCEAEFYNKQDLIDHMTSHSGVKQFPCHVCDKSYTRKRALKVHLQLHSGEKRFCCDTCGKRFLQKCTLNKHIETHNKNKHLETHKRISQSGLTQK